MRLLRYLKEDCKEFPATMALGTAWIVVFLAMLAHQAWWDGGLTPRMVVTGTNNSVRFGALSLAHLQMGEYWRLLTATFVHYGIIHIAMNLFAYYQLGCLVESWYGAGPSVVIYVLTGGGGNLLASLTRVGLHSNHGFVSAGGSTVVMGLVAVCAVVGWNARTRMGDHLRNQMVLAIVLTGALGLFCLVPGMPAIDNWGHAGGCVMGALIGLASPYLIRNARTIAARTSGWLATGLIAACAFAQVADESTTRNRNIITQAQIDAASRRLFNDERLMFRIDEIRQVIKTVATPRAIRRGSLERIPRGAVPLAKPAAPPPPPADAAGPGAKNNPLAPPAPTQIRITLDPEQEFALVVLTSTMKSLGSLAPELKSFDSSADYRAAYHILETTLANLPRIEVTLEEVRDFDRHLAAIHQSIRKDRDAAGKFLKTVNRR